MGKVIFFNKNKSKNSRSGLTPERWKIVLDYCGDLFYDHPDLKRRPVTPPEETRRQILSILSMHFSSKEATTVVQMILLSYQICLLDLLWAISKDTQKKIKPCPDFNKMYKEISRLLGIAHMERSTSRVLKKFIELRNLVELYDEMI